MLGHIWALVNLFFILFFFICAFAQAWAHLITFQKKDVMKKKEYSSSKSSDKYRKIVPNVVKYCQTISSKYVFCWCIRKCVKKHMPWIFFHIWTIYFSQSKRAAHQCHCTCICCTRKLLKHGHSSGNWGKSDIAICRSWTLHNIISPR